MPLTPVSIVQSVTFTDVTLTAIPFPTTPKRSLVTISFNCAQWEVLDAHRLHGKWGAIADLCCLLARFRHRLYRISAAPRPPQDNMRSRELTDTPERCLISKTWRLVASLIAHASLAGPRHQLLPKCRDSGELSSSTQMLPAVRDFSFVKYMHFCPRRPPFQAKMRLLAAASKLNGRHQRSAARVCE